MTAAYTLPLTATLAEWVARHDRQPFSGEPTWARRINGAGQHQRVHLRQAGTVDGVETWEIPAEMLSPGDRVEVGPVATHIRITTGPALVTVGGYAPRDLTPTLAGSRL